MLKDSKKGADDRRGDPRYPAELHARYVSARLDTAVELTDFSQRGCFARGTSTDPVGTRGVLHVRDDVGGAELDCVVMHEGAKERADGPEHGMGLRVVGGAGLDVFARLCARFEQPIDPSNDRFTVHVTFEATPPVLTVRGRVDTREPFDTVRPYLWRLHEDLVARGAQLVLVDLRELAFMNSNGVKAFISWFNRLNETPEASKYTIRFRCSRVHVWQQRSLPIWRSYCPKSVEYEGV